MITPADKGKQHTFATPDVPWDDNDYRAHEKAEAAKAGAGGGEREAEQKQRMDAAHEKAKAERERCVYVGGRDDTRCLLTEGHTGTHHFGTRAWLAAREGSEG